MKRLYYILVTLSILILGCTKEECAEFVPAITIDEVQRGLETTVVVLEVRDCDGDIGLDEGDTAGPYKFNAFIDIRPWVNGDWAENTYDFVDTSYREVKNDSGIVIGYDTIVDTLNYYYRVPFVDNESRSDIYDAKIELDLGTADVGFDTFRFEARLRDKALNESNVALSETQFFYRN